MKELISIRLEKETIEELQKYRNYNQIVREAIERELEELRYIDSISVKLKTKE